ncbi:MAG: response regulator [Desulfamplus sp.]|nr:response regulator [Desulfamplus sp.]
MIKMTKVMIVEGDDSVIKELKMQLSYLYCDVISTVGSGEKALDFLSSISDEDSSLLDEYRSISDDDSSLLDEYRSISDEDIKSYPKTTIPDVIFLDIGLNKEDSCSTNITSSHVNHLMDASETAKEIRDKHHIPIIFIVRHTNEDSISEVKLDFPFGYVLTPISTRELKVTIDVAIYTAKIEAERIKAQQELKKSDERYKALFDNMVSGVAIYEVVGDGEDFIFADLNKAGETIENQKREELIGRSIFEVRPGVAEFGLVDTFRKVFKTGEPYHHPINLYKDDRVTRYYENYVYKLSSGEIVALFRDETIKKVSEDEMRRLESQLNHAQKMEAIGIMAGGIAHDFNNILFPIIGAAEMLAEDSTEGSTQKLFISEILKAGYRAKELVKQILTFSRQADQEMTPLSIQPILKEIIKLARSMLPSTIKINQYIPKNCCMVNADPTQVHQVFMNLIINAFHAMENTDGTLTIKLSESENPPVYIDNYEIAQSKSDIRIDDIVKNTTFDNPKFESASGKYLCIEVSDTGVGMDKATLQRIFEPYFTTKELGKGTGLGLAVVHGIVKRCKGDIVVTSELGKGTSFKIYLPGVEQTTFDTIESSTLKKATGSETILVVDDEPVVAKMFGQILKRAGYKVFIEIDSLDALENFREKPDMYDLVITDLTMPGITGEKLCAALKIAKPNIPVILCTGFSGKAADLEKNNFGIDRVVMKPIISNDLLKAVRELLDLHLPHPSP